MSGAFTMRVEPLGHAAQQLVAGPVAGLSFVRIDWMSHTTPTPMASAAMATAIRSGSDVARDVVGVSIASSVMCLRDANPAGPFTG